jgi:hypothetical protein
MSRQTERAEAGTRITMTETERSTYKGIARHPLARRWMQIKLIEARQNAADSESEHEIKRWMAEASRIEAEINECRTDKGVGK